MNILRSLVDIVYPPTCHACGRFLEGTEPETTVGFFCSACAADFTPVPSPCCAVCAAPFQSAGQDDHTCEACLRKRPFFERIHAGYLYRGAVREAVHRFKYGGETLLSGSLGPLLAEFAAARVERSGTFMTVPVPLHPKRLRQRGYNQSLLLARHVAARLATPLDFLSLRRVRHTAPQSGLGSEERRRNVRGAFAVNNPGVVKGKTVLLVDDVATTGNTLNECARVLGKAGCERILCVVLARAG